ncbi:hypothetical protein [Mitsuaria sp. 7]|uniref:hypothetical protein n=1 Tax=Mitsuaria sp. 7 TaxID=1658665 RepID=UPI0007DD8AB2|nr:hypothetical protein [Mitsuaria sp. 7]ANH67270.1 hypothetical protein ABE85_06255 [Mitsuaria sp. 7]
MKRTHRNALIGLVASLAAVSAQAAGYDAASGPRAIKEINFQMTPETAGGAYYIVAEGGWQATGCPNARFAYVPESWSGAKSALAMALTAKASGRMVRVSGYCGDSAGDPAYMRLYYITIE